MPFNASHVFRCWPFRLLYIGFGPIHPLTLCSIATYCYAFDISILSCRRSLFRERRWAIKEQSFWSLSHQSLKPGARSCTAEYSSVKSEIALQGLAEPFVVLTLVLILALRQQETKRPQTLHMKLTRSGRPSLLFAGSSVGLSLSHYSYSAECGSDLWTTI